MPQYASLHTHFLTEVLRLVTYVQLAVLNNVKVTGIGYITPLVIYSLGDEHTYTNTHTNNLHRINFKKPDMCQPSTGACLV